MLFGCIATSLPSLKFAGKIKKKITLRNNIKKNIIPQKNFLCLFFGDTNTIAIY